MKVFPRYKSSLASRTQSCLRRRPQRTTDPRDLTVSLLARVTLVVGPRRRVETAIDRYVETRTVNWEDSGSGGRHFSRTTLLTYSSTSLVLQTVNLRRWYFSVPSSTGSTQTRSVSNGRRDLRGPLRRCTEDNGIGVGWTRTVEGCRGRGNDHEVRGGLHRSGRGDGRTPSTGPSSPWFCRFRRGKVDVPVKGVL